MARENIRPEKFIGASKPQTTNENCEIAAFWLETCLNRHGEYCLTPEQKSIIQTAMARIGNSADTVEHFDVVRRTRAVFYQRSNDKIQIDEDAVVSRGEDAGGCWVSAWLWLSDEDADEEEENIR